MKTILIKNASVINENQIEKKDILIQNEKIEKIADNIDQDADLVIDATGKHLIPGMIDDQVHFREPGLTYKADIYTESRAAVAGGITSFMEMPNTKPPIFTNKALEEKYEIASKKSLANYSFYLGASNDNIEELLKVDNKKVCGIKVFMGSSTGNLLVDDENTLERIFSETNILIATHCESEEIIKSNIKSFTEKYGEKLNATFHPKIRSAEACYASSSFAVQLAKKHNTRLHVLHLSTGHETELFENNVDLKEKRITAEACVHHLFFDDSDYEEKGNFIKWNPAIKTQADKEKLLEAVLNGKLDVIATDHAPHTLEEKSRHYSEAPSGGPLVQHALNVLFELYHEGKISLEQIVEKTAHNPAIIFQIQNRGFIKEGFYADLVLVDLDKNYTVKKENILYKCGWSPFEGMKFNSYIEKTFVNGHLAYDSGNFDESKKGMRLLFERE